MAETRYIKTTDEKGSVNISQSVLATIAAAAAMDVDGVFGLYRSSGKEPMEARGRKGVLKGSKITIDDKSITADVYLVVEVGYSVGKVGEAVQRAVKTAIEEAVGTSVDTVNIHICGISMKKGKQAAQATAPAETESKNKKK